MEQGSTFLRSRAKILFGKASPYREGSKGAMVPRRRKEDIYSDSAIASSRWASRAFPAAVVVAFLLFAHWTVSEYYRSRRSWDRRLEERGKEFTLALTGSVQSQLRLEAFVSRSKLNTVLEVLLRSNGWIDGVDVYCQGGDLLASTSASGPAVKRGAPAAPSGKSAQNTSCDPSSSREPSPATRALPMRVKGSSDPSCSKIHGSARSWPSS